MCRIAWHSRTEIELRVPGAFSNSEPLAIQKITLHWDWRVDKSNKPACGAQLLNFQEQLFHPSSVIEEIGYD